MCITKIMGTKKYRVSSLRLRFLVVNRLILARLVPHLSQVRLAELRLLRNLFGGFLLTPHFQNLLHPQPVDDGSGQSGDRQHDRSAADASHGICQTMAGDRHHRPGSRNWNIRERCGCAVPASGARYVQFGPPSVGRCPGGWGPLAAAGGGSGLWHTQTAFTAKEQRREGLIPAWNCFLSHKNRLFP